MLNTIWFVLWGLLWAIYFALDGFDFGLGMLLPVLGRSQVERKVVYQAMGPFWDGNEVWLITAGGVTFAAFPSLYATMFSILYGPLLVILFALIFRGVAIEYRWKVASEGWGRFWDWMLVLSSLVAALFFGVAFANLFKGLPFDSRGICQGCFLGLLNPYGIMGGLTLVAMFCYHGALWLGVRASGELEQRAQAAAKGLWWAVVVTVVLMLFASAFSTKLYANYLRWPLMWIIPLACAVGIVLSRVWVGKGAWVRAWWASAVGIVGFVLFGIGGMYPAMLISSIEPGATLTAFNASSSPLTLKIMLGVALVMVPIVIIYQAWAYKRLGFKMPPEGLPEGY